jgi:DNA-binding XRE family transcriptional regulator
VPTSWYNERKEKGVLGVGKKEFSTVRQYLAKTHNQMAQLLGVSLKAIQSFEQGGGISQSILNVRSFFF